MYSKTFEQHMENHIVEELALYGITDVEGKTRKELRAELAVLKAKEININAPENSFF